MPSCRKSAHQSSVPDRNRTEREDRSTKIFVYICIYRQYEDLFTFGSSLYRTCLRLSCSRGCIEYVYPLICHRRTDKPISVDLDATSQKPLKQSLAATRGTKTTFAGVNLSGFDFGCQQDGSFVASSMTPPLSSKGGPDGIGQMKHFATNDKLNVFRLPVAWQYLQPSLGGALDSSHLSEYDQLMQGCLATGAHCIIDIHNYARYNGGIVGQGGPSDAQFANLWSRLAAKYAGSANVIFGLMNEPHDRKCR